MRFGLTFQQERFSDLRLEACELFKETDWASYLAMEDAGTVLALTMRDYGKLVGYAVYIVGHDLAECDAVFVEPRRRMGHASLHFFRFAEATLLDRGVREIKTSIRPINRQKRGDHSLAPLFMRMGYRLQSLVYGKALANE